MKAVGCLVSKAKSYPGTAAADGNSAAVPSASVLV